MSLYAESHKCVCSCVHTYIHVYPWVYMCAYLHTFWKVLGILRKTVLSECTPPTLLWVVKSLANTDLTKMDLSHC